MKHMDPRKYVAVEGARLKKRGWPDRRLTKAPRWCSVDLRDGNQALGNPMSVETKLEFFAFLVSIGFKEIEVGFPSASETEFTFVQRLIDEGRIPDDVTIQVLTQARRHLIERTVESLKGSPRSIIHIYNSTSPDQREIVFKKTQAEIRDIAVEGVKAVRELSRAAGLNGVTLQYSPESFTATEPEYALEVCRAVIAAWKPAAAEKVILNLPATTEIYMPNIYADTIEWFCGSIPERNHLVISVHAHNDRGTAVAAAELAVLAGADRVEGALFGNGERCGNMDLVTMALNLFSQGIDPELDLSDINRVREVYERCTGMTVHPRHPYAGDLVYTAFSGSHQDAIGKGLKAQAGSPGKWRVPYLPIDPGDVGRSYEAIIRINSQSGKGGVAFILEQRFGLIIPKWMQADLAAHVQAQTDRAGRELTPDEIRDCFVSEYIGSAGPYALASCRIETGGPAGAGHTASVTAELQVAQDLRALQGSGNGPIDAFLHALSSGMGEVLGIDEYAEHAVGHGSGARAAAYVAVRDAAGKILFGAGIDEDITMASFKAVLNALNRR